MRGVNRNSVLTRTLAAGIMGAAYGFVLARYVTPRVLSVGALSQENMVLMALKYSPWVNALAKVAVAGIVAIHCGLLRTSSRRRSAREKLTAAGMSFAACLAAVLAAGHFLK